MTTQHTPGKLTVSYDGKLLAERQDCSHAIVAQMPVWFADKRNQGHATQDHQEANAARLALCWNTHDELVEVCGDMLELLTTLRYGKENVCQRSRAVLAKATGKE